MVLLYKILAVEYCSDKKYIMPTLRGQSFAGVKKQLLLNDTQHEFPQRYNLANYVMYEQKMPLTTKRWLQKRVLLVILEWEVMLCYVT